MLRTTARAKVEAGNRMDKSGNKKAVTGKYHTAVLLNEYCEEALQNLFSSYGEVRNSKTLAKAVVNARRIKPLETIADLNAIAVATRKGEEHKYLAQVFQAIRIEVNDEMGALKDFLL